MATLVSRSGLEHWQRDSWRRIRRTWAVVRTAEHCVAGRPSAERRQWDGVPAHSPIVAPLQRSNPGSNAHLHVVAIDGADDSRQPPRMCTVVLGRQPAHEVSLDGLCRITPARAPGSQVCWHGCDAATPPLHAGRATRFARSTDLRQADLSSGRGGDPVETCGVGRPSGGPGGQDGAVRAHSSTRMNLPAPADSALR